MSGYPQANSGTRSNGLAVASLVCGIVGLIIFGIILGPLAIIFGGVGLSRANNGAAHKGMAIWGLVLGIIDVVALVAILALSKNHQFHYYVKF